MMESVVKLWRLSSTAAVARQFLNFRLKANSEPTGIRRLNCNRQVMNYRSYHLSRPYRCKNNADVQNGEPVPKQSIFKKFKQMYKDYWYVLVPVHIVTSCGWFAGFYQLSKSGVDLGYYMGKMGFSDNVVKKVTETSMGHLAVMYALYKIATPARYTVTLGCTTISIKYLKNLGYIKPAKVIYNKSKDKLHQKKEKFLKNRDKS